MSACHYSPSQAIPARPLRRKLMHRLLTRICLVTAALGATAFAAVKVTSGPTADFGAFVAAQLSSHSEELFGFTHPLEQSAIGPFSGPSVNALELAQGLTATLVSSSVHNSADQIALWPNDDHPTHLFVCDEESQNPAVQRIDLSLPA